MFTSKLANMKNELAQATHGILLSYAKSRYKETDLEKVFTGEHFLKDNLMLFLGEQYMSMGEGNPVLIDFTKDIETLKKSLDTEQKLQDFITVVTEDLLHGDGINMPFDDVMFYVGNVQAANLEVQQDAIVRVENVTKQWDEGRGVWQKVVQVCMYSRKGVGLDMRLDESMSMAYAQREASKYKPVFHVPTMCPLTLHIDATGERTHQRNPFDDIGNAFMYPGDSIEKINDWESKHASLCMFVVGAFQMLYKHQKISYAEVVAPEGLQRKRRKKKAEPYTNYYVSKLGDFTKSVYTESESTGKENHGVALHIRRGHWKLKWGHSRLPEEKQEKIFIDPTLAGDPRFGIVLRDYESHLAEGEEVVTPEAMKKVLDGMNRALKE